MTITLLKKDLLEEAKSCVECEIYLAPADKNDERYASQWKYQEDMTLDDLADEFKGSVYEMDEEDYSGAFDGDVDFDVWFDDKNAKVLVIVIDLESCYYLKKDKPLETLREICMQNNDEYYSRDEFNVVKEIKLEGASLYIFSFCDVCTSAAIMYDNDPDNTVFYLNDWQWSYPETAEEIKDYEWHYGNNSHAVIVGGLPRII